MIVFSTSNIEYFYLVCDYNPQNPDEIQIKVFIYLFNGFLDLLNRYKVGHKVTILKSYEDGWVTAFNESTDGITFSPIVN